jgi:transcription antitermination factor NusG
MNGYAWYVVHAQPRKERFVGDRIRDLGREVFLPLISERRRGQRRSTVGPLFPGYLFALLSEPDGDLPRVRWTQGVRRVLGDGPTPRPVAEEVVQTIRERADRTGRVRLGKGLAAGARVRIVDGPLAGLVGILERPVSDPRERVGVLLELFHRPTRVDVPAAMVVGFGRA